jgi:hypothetical protein
MTVLSIATGRKKKKKKKKKKNKMKKINPHFWK